MNTPALPAVTRGMSDTPRLTADDHARERILRIQAALADTANAVVGLRELTRDHGGALDDASNALCRAVADAQIAFVRMTIVLREHGPLAVGE